MQFDDRLLTVLRQRTGGDAAKRTQFRQLVDLLGRPGCRPYGEVAQRAYQRLGELTDDLPRSERARLVGDPTIRIENIWLTAFFADAEPDVVRAAIGKTRLTEREWIMLIPELPATARGLLRHRRDLPERAKKRLEWLGLKDRGLPRPATDMPVAPVVEITVDTPVGSALPDAPLNLPTGETELADEFAPGSVRFIPSADHPAPSAALPSDAIDHEPAPGEPANDIASLRRRIESFQSERTARRGEGDAPLLPLGDGFRATSTAVQSFDFGTDALGRIEWADPAVAPMVAGQLLSDIEQAAWLAQATPSLAILRQRPLIGGRVTLAGAPAIAGTWRIDATPHFDSTSGRYHGHIGRMRREQSTETDTGPHSAAALEADRMRQLLHELRTPVNAIQGFAEVIQQQLFGAVPHNYRAVAAGIAGDAAHMLAGFDELDRFARLESGALELEAGSCDLAERADAIVARLKIPLGSRNATMNWDRRASGMVSLAAVEVDALLWRLLATLAGSAAPGESIGLELEASDDDLALSAHLPHALAQREDLFAAGAPRSRALTAGLFGAGFALRLARAEARASGGDLSRDGTRLTLKLPQLTKTQGNLSHIVG